MQNLEVYDFSAENNHAQAAFDFEEDWFVGDEPTFPDGDTDLGDDDDDFDTP